MAGKVIKRVEPISVTLSGDLDGHTILVDPGALTMGLLEDIQAGTAHVMLDAVAATLSGGDLPLGVDRAGLRRLTPSEFADLCAGVASCINIKKKT
jgi:hypothetical protein